MIWGHGQLIPVKLVKSGSACPNFPPWRLRHAPAAASAPECGGFFGKRFLTWLGTRRVSMAHALALVGEAQPAPMAPRDRDRGREILHHHHHAPAHVAAIDLQQKRRRGLAGPQPDTAIKDAPVAAMGGVPDRIIAFRLGKLGAVRSPIVSWVRD